METEKEKNAKRSAIMLEALLQIDRLSREADRNLVDVASMLGDIARNTIRLVQQ